MAESLQILALSCQAVSQLTLFFSKHDVCRTALP